VEASEKITRSPALTMFIALSLFVTDLIFLTCRGSRVPIIYSSLLITTIGED
jgi:hypothetical protein